MKCVLCEHIDFVGADKIGRGADRKDWVIGRELLLLPGLAAIRQVETCPTLLGPLPRQTREETVGRVVVEPGRCGFVVELKRVEEINFKRFVEFSTHSRAKLMPLITNS